MESWYVEWRESLKLRKVAPGPKFRVHRAQVEFIDASAHAIDRGICPNGCGVLAAGLCSRCGFRFTRVEKNGPTETRD